MKRLTGWKGIHTNVEGQNHDIAPGKSGFILGVQCMGLKIVSRNAKALAVISPVL